MAETESAGQEAWAAAGRAWQAAGAPARARTCFCRAANTGDTLNETWLEYLAFLIAEDGTEAAVSEITWRERQHRDDPAAARLPLAAGWEMIGRAELAEPYYRSAAQSASQHLPALSIHLARRGNIEEAVRLIADQPKTLSPTVRAHTMAVAGLAAGSIDPETEATIERVIRAGLEDPSQEPQMLVAVANWYVLRGRNEDAEAILNRAIVTDPNDLVAANNLAMLLAENPQQCQQALAAIDSVLEKAGPAGEFLDTRGWVLLQMNRPQEAAEQFRLAIASRVHPDPLPHFHLAAAYLAAGDPHQARAQWDRAQQLRLDPAVLYRSERRALDVLQRTLSASRSEGVR